MLWRFGQFMRLRGVYLRVCILLSGTRFGCGVAHSGFVLSMMAEDLIYNIDKIHLSVVETEEIMVTDYVPDLTSTQTDFCLVFTLLMRKFVNNEAFRNMMKMLWNPKGVKFFDLSDGLFLMQFTDVVDKSCVIRNGLWFFDKSLVLMWDYDGNIRLFTLCLNRASFWIKLFDLPLNCMNPAVLHMIGNTIREVEDIDIPEAVLA